MRYTSRTVKDVNKRKLIGFGVETLKSLWRN